MSNAEHLIENAIIALRDNRDIESELNKDYNQKMMALTGIRQSDLVRMAEHVVYSLYDGIFPGDCISLKKTKQELEDGTWYQKHWV